MEILNTIIDYIESLGLSSIGSYASIIGLVISALTLWLVFSIKKKFIFRSRLEEHRKSLRSKASNLSNLFNNFEDNLDEIANEFAIVNVKLRNIQRGATDYLYSDIKKARKKIQIFRFKLSFKWFSEPKESDARKIYTAINVVVEELGNVKKEIMVGK